MRREVAFVLSSERDKRIADNSRSQCLPKHTEKEKLGKGSFLSCLLLFSP